MKFGRLVRVRIGGDGDFWRLILALYRSPEHAERASASTRPGLTDVRLPNGTSQGVPRWLMVRRAAVSDTLCLSIDGGTVTALEDPEQAGMVRLELSVRQFLVSIRSRG